MAAAEVAEILACSSQVSTDDGLIEALAKAPMSCELMHLGKTLNSAEEVTEAIGAMDWPRVTRAQTLTGPFGEQGKALVAQLQGALHAHELSQPLDAKLEQISEALQALIEEASRELDAELRRGQAELRRAQEEQQKKEAALQAKEAELERRRRADAETPQEPSREPPSPGTLRHTIPPAELPEALRQVQAFVEKHPDEEIEITLRIRPRTKGK